MTDDITRTLKDLTALLTASGIDYMVVGSVAALAHGRARSTQDFDLVARLTPESLEAFLNSLPADRFYVSREAAAEAVRRQTLFNVIDMVTGWKADIIPLKRRAFSVEEFDRRTTLHVLDLELAVATVEDVVISKLEWSKLGGGSRRQLEDVQELLPMSRGRLDVEYIERWVAALGLADEWKSVRG